MKRGRFFYFTEINLRRRAKNWNRRREGSPRTTWIFRSATPVPIVPGQLETDIRSELEILGEGAHKQIKLDIQKTEDVFFGDKEVILEVTENLLSNALRHAENQVEIKIHLTGTTLKISVKNDGAGFMEEAEKITAPFHQQNVKDSLKHAGMGMYICRRYCEKHGGRLILENTKTGEALVTAVFNRIV